MEGAVGIEQTVGDESMNVRMKIEEFSSAVIASDPGEATRARAINAITKKNSPADETRRQGEKLPVVPQQSQSEIASN